MKNAIHIFLKIRYQAYAIDFSLKKITTLSGNTIRFKDNKINKSIDFNIRNPCSEKKGHSYKNVTGKVLHSKTRVALYHSLIQKKKKDRDDCIIK